MKGNTDIQNGAVLGSEIPFFQQPGTEEPIHWILSKWHILACGKIGQHKNELLLFPDDDITSIIAQSEALQDKIKNLLFNALIDRPLIKDKRQFVQLTQSLIIRLLNTLFESKQNLSVDNRRKSLIQTIITHLQNTLDFIEEFFSGYFDRTQKVPVSYLSVCKDELGKQIGDLCLLLEKSDPIDQHLSEIISEFFRRFMCLRARSITYEQLAYCKHLLSQFFSERETISTLRIRETFYYLNFNEENFVFYELERLKHLTEDILTRKEKMSVLYYEQKLINQLPALVNNGYTTDMPSLKEQVTSWINEEVKYLEKDCLQVNMGNTFPDSENKINTSLSVAKLAVLIRLLVVDKIIINRQVAPMLRVIAKTFTTLQKDEISFGSLETKYHAPDKATINTVRDMLFKWINILGKL